MINQVLIQQEYGFLGDIIHVNPCYAGVPPLRVQKAASEFMKVYMPMVCEGSHIDFGWLRDKVRNQIADLIHADPDEIAFTKNTTEGTATLAWGYPLGPDDNVVVADLEDPSNLYPWLHAAKSKNFNVKLIKTDGRSISLGNYLDNIDEHTKIVAASFVQADSGARIALSELGNFCRKKGIILSVDAIQGIGRLNVDVRECSIDYLSCGGFKALGAGFGIGFSYCRKEILPNVAPMIVGSGSTINDPIPPRVYTNNDVLHFLNNAERFEGGSTNTIGIWLLHHSLSLQSELGKENIDKHVIGLERILRDKLKGCSLDILPISDLPSGMIVAWYPAEHYNLVEDILNKKHICLTHYPGYIRMSIAAHNTVHQMNIIADAFYEIDKLVNKNIESMKDSDLLI